MDNNICLYGKEFSGDELVACDVVALMTGLSKRTVEDMASRRELPMYKISKRANRFKVSEILNWIEMRKLK